MTFSLVGPRVTLRDWDLADRDQALKYASDLDVVRFMPWGPHKTAEDIDPFLARAVEQQRQTPRLIFELAVEWRETGEVIGGSGIRIPNEMRSTNGEIGYVFRKDHWGRGIATEVAELLIDFGFTELELHRIAAGVDPENIASQRVLEKCGMRREAHFREDVLRRGEWRDSYIYAIIEPEWRKRRHSSH